jgi:hypothetical protein
LGTTGSPNTIHESCFAEDILFIGLSLLVNIRDFFSFDALWPKVLSSSFLYINALLCSLQSHQSAHTQSTTNGWGNENTNKKDESFFYGIIVKNWIICPMEKITYGFTFIGDVNLNARKKLFFARKIIFFARQIFFILNARKIIFFARISILNAR